VTEESRDDATEYSVTAPEQATQPQTRFVVDILSGTSAGGINAIYLAKALVNNQSLDAIARMWLDVADFEKLLNDKRSEEPPVTAQDPPQSLLNSQWMYLKLLNALDVMDQSGMGRNSLVNDLDLFSTTTDLDGVALPLALADRQVKELRHRNVFHFRTREGDREDFHSRINPFLAFAARCTSAFPFAFEPMALCDVFKIIRRLPQHADNPYCRDNGKSWERFYKDYVRNQDGAVSEFTNRPFGDGGYLDNKPFSYAVDTAMTRRADIPVDRKLIYVEPSPEDVGMRQKTRTGGMDRPDAVENSLAALITLPRYETIREDLERVLEWNRNVLRLKRVLSRVLGDSQNLGNYQEGPAYQFYLRLRRSSVTDRMAERVTEALELDPKSAHGEAVRALAGAWRHKQYTKRELDDRTFFDTYDVDFLFRAARYLRSRLLNHKPCSEDMQKPEDAQKLKDARENLSEALKMLARLEDLPLTSAVPKEIQPYHQERKDDLDFITNPARAWERLRGTGDMQEELLRADGVGYQKRLEYILQRWYGNITKIYEQLQTLFELGPDKKGGMSQARRHIHEAMRFLGEEQGWDRFNLQDSLAFPLTFGTSLGEVDPIDIIRISPADVTPIAGTMSEGGRPTLKGKSLGAFGAFLDRRWRLHDMLFGRLHAAERLITAVLPGAGKEESKIREALIREAQEEIAIEFEDTYRDVIEAEEIKRAATIANTRS
jgi:predicted acylesterase/phospholipase RssA